MDLPESPSYQDFDLQLREMRESGEERRRKHIKVVKKLKETEGGGLRVRHNKSRSAAAEDEPVR